MPRGPLARSYPGAVALVVFSLIPYLVLTAGIFPLLQTIGRTLDLSSTALDLALAMSTGAYAVGTVLAVQFAVHLPGRRMLVLYESLFVVASFLAASTSNGVIFIVAFISQGFCTSLMLIAAVPPLVTRWPAEKMPVTGTIMNLCIFGAVALGPSAGAALASQRAWRPLFFGVAGLAVLALLSALATFEDDPAADHSAPWDFVALGLAVAGCGSAFYGAGHLQAALRADAQSLAPLVTGFALLVLLVVYEARLHHPLMPVREALTTVPVAGIYIALMTSAAAFGLMELALIGLKSAVPPGTIALEFLPEFLGAIAAAGIFGLLFRTRFTPLLALGGLLAVVAASVLLLLALPANGGLVAAATGLLGVGVGASVSPALFMAGFSMRSPLLQRIFAMIELMRGVTAFLVAPILVFLASVLAPPTSRGLRGALVICLAIASAGFVGGCLIYVTGRKGLETPDLHRWQEHDEPAWSSPPLFGRLRGRAGAERSAGSSRAAA